MRIATWGRNLEATLHSPFGVAAAALAEMGASAAQPNLGTPRMQQLKLEPTHMETY